MNYTTKWFWLSIGKLLSLLLFLSHGLEVVGAEHHTSDSSITIGKEAGFIEGSLDQSNNGRIRRQSEPTSNLEHLYKTLYERGLIKMCSILRNSDQKELNQTLGKNRDFTILAPSDEAFNLIPGSQFEEIKNDKQKRQEFIRQHIIPSRLPLSSFRAFDQKEVLNANGLKLHITAYPNGFVINGANAVDGDIPVPNTKGLVQVVDKVLYPQKQINLLQVLEENPHLTQISSFLALSGLQNELTTNDSFTFFAPNDEAFRAVPWPVTQQMLSNNTFLKLLIANHVIPGKHYSTGLTGNKLSSIGGNPLNFTSRTVQSHSLVLVNLVPIIEADLIATNGVVQVITRIMLPKELMDDCNCLQNETTTKQPTDSSQNTTLDPLLKEMLGTDPRFNNIDRRYGSQPTVRPKNGDHFASTAKPVTYKSFWDDIFVTPEENITKSQPDIPVNMTQTTIGDGISTNGSTPSSTTIQNTTDLPFIWDFLTTETSQTLNQTTGRLTDRTATTRANDSTSTLLPSSRMSPLRQFTAGVQYLDDQTNGTTNTINATVSDTATTALPSMWTRPFYRPERKNRTETTATNISTTSDTPLTLGSSFFRPTMKPILRPSTTKDEFNPQSNTVPPYDRRSGLQRERTPEREFESRSRMVSPITQPFEQLRDDPYVEQLIEPQFQSNRTQDPYQRDGNYSDPQQPYQRPTYRPVEDRSRPAAQTLGSDRLRPSVESQRNRSRHSPEEYQNIEQKPYSGTSWSHHQNHSGQVSPQVYGPYSQPINRSEPQSGADPKSEATFSWWDSRYEPEPESLYYRAPAQAKGQSQAQRPGLSSSDRTRLQPNYPQTQQNRAQRPRVLIPSVVYEDEERPVPVPQYPRRDGLTRPYYTPNTTSVKTYPQTYPNRQQTPYYRRAQPQPQPISSRKTQIPSKDVYSRQELIDRSYVPYYNPYMTDMSPPQIVTGEYPYLHNIDHTYMQPSPQYMQPTDPRSPRISPYDRRRPASPSKTTYDTIRRRGDNQKPLRSDYQKPATVPETPESDLKTISEIMESPDLLIGQKFKTFNNLKDLVNGSGLWDALNRPTTYITMFMPTDDAFSAITDGSVEQLKQNPKLVKDFLTQHILGYSLQPQNLKNNIKVKSLNGEMHLINVVDGKIFIDGIDVIAATTAKNGNVYVLDKVLDRSGRRSRSIADELKRRPDLSIFSSLFQRSDINKMLSEETGPFTLLVPNNEALNKMNLRETIRNQKDLNDFMKKHLIDGAVYSNQLSKDISDPNRDIRRIGLTSDAPISINNSTQVITPDITTENGVLHVIDGVLPEKINITESSQTLNETQDSNRNAKQLTITRNAQNLGIRRFTNWLKKSGLIDELTKDGRQYTVIVPTDRAVGKLPLKIQSILNSETSRLRSLLEYHVIPGFVDTKTLNDNEMLTTINNRKIRFNRLDNGKVVMFSGAPVSRQSIEQNLQVISVDTVLYPPQGTIQDLIIKSPLLKTLNEIIKTAKMDDELRNSSDITLFAPKDEAFKQMDAEILQRLKTDQNYSREFLKKHIMPKVMFTSALQSSDTNIQREQALSGETLKIYRKPNCVSVNGIILSFADITASNGVLHIVDHTI